MSLLAFAEFTKEQKLINENLRLLEEAATKAAPGAIANHNGNLSEIALHNVFHQYQQRRDPNGKHKWDHGRTMDWLKRKGGAEGEPRAQGTRGDPRPLRPRDVTGVKEGGSSRLAPYKDYIHKALTAHGYDHSKDAQHPDNQTPHKEVTRTLWDGHHAGIKLLDHIHTNLGDISPSHAPVHTGPDASGEHAKKLTGAKTTADVLVPYHDRQTGKLSHAHIATRIDNAHPETGVQKVGHIGASMKYSTTADKKDTKVKQHGMPDFVAAVQKAHVAIHGEEHHGLRMAAAALNAGAGAAEQETLKKHHDYLHQQFGTNTKPGKSLMKDSQKKSSGAARFTHDASTDTRILNPAGRSMLRKIRDGRMQGVQTAPGHTPDMSPHKAKKVYHEIDAHNKSTEGPFTDHLHSALKSIFHDHDPSNRAHATAAHKLARHISGVTAPRSVEGSAGAKTLLVSIKSKRSKDDNKGYGTHKPESMPSVHIGDPQRAHENYINRSRENGAKSNEMFPVHRGVVKDKKTGKTTPSGGIKVGDAKLRTQVSDAGHASIVVQHSHNFHFDP